MGNKLFKKNNSNDIDLIVILTYINKIKGYISLLEVKNPSNIYIRKIKEELKNIEEEITPIDLAPSKL